MKSKLAGVLLHGRVVRGDDDFFGSEADGLRGLPGRGGEEDHVGAESLRQFDAHVA
jgi:hypothetical protein